MSEDKVKALAEKLGEYEILCPVSRERGKLSGNLFDEDLQALARVALEYVEERLGGRNLFGLTRSQQAAVTKANLEKYAKEEQPWSPRRS